MVRCNNCMKVCTEDKLILLEDKNGFFKGCSNCKTDAYLMNTDGYKCPQCNSNNTETYVKSREQFCLDCSFEFPLEEKLAKELEQMENNS